MSLRPQEARTEARRKSYKTGVDGDGARRRREDNFVAIRKNKREDSLLKKRREGFHDADAASDQWDDFPAADHVDLEKQLKSIHMMAQGVSSDDPILQFEATCQFRKLLSIEGNPPIDEVIQTGVIPRFVNFLGRNDAPRLQIEATWALAYVASGTTEHIKVVIQHEAIPMFVKLLSSASDEVREQAVWALGIVACASPSCRDIVLGYGTLVPLLRQLNERTRLTMLRNATWTLFNLCRNKPPAPFELVKPALPVLCQLLHLQDEEVLADACWALSYLSDYEVQAVIEAMAEAGGCQQLVQLLLHPSQTVSIPALRMVGNIANGDDSQTQFIVDNQVLPFLFQLLAKSLKNDIKKEVCWIVSNITAGTQTQIQAVIDANIIRALVQLLQTAELGIKKEAAWTISNATSGGSHEQIRVLARQGCIKPLCDLLTCSDPQILDVCLEALANILKVGEADKESGLTNGTNPYVGLIDECEGLYKIENLQIHENEEVFGKAVELLCKYWAEEDEEENITQSGFSFGKNQPSLPSGGFKFG